MRMRLDSDAVLEPRGWEPSFRACVAVYSARMLNMSSPDVCLCASGEDGEKQHVLSWRPVVVASTGGASDLDEAKTGSLAQQKCLVCAAT